MEQVTNTENEVLCARIDELCAANERLRNLVKLMWPVFIRRKRATFADRLRVRNEIDNLGIEVEIDG